MRLEGVLGLHSAEGKVLQTVGYSGHYSRQPPGVQAPRNPESTCNPLPSPPIQEKQPSLPPGPTMPARSAPCARARSVRAARRSGTCFCAAFESRCCTQWVEAACCLLAPWWPGARRHSRRWRTACELAPRCTSAAPSWAALVASACYRGRGAGGCAAAAVRWGPPASPSWLTRTSSGLDDGSPVGSENVLVAAAPAAPSAGAAALARRRRGAGPRMSGDCRLGGAAQRGRGEGRMRWDRAT